MELRLRYLILSVALFLTCNGMASAQTRTIDSLVHVLKKMPKDTNYVHVLIDLCFEYQYTNKAEALLTADQAQRLAKDIGYSEGEALAYNSSAWTYVLMNDPVKAIEHYLYCLRIYETIGDLDGVACSYSNIGGVYMDVNNFQMAHEYYAKALSIWHKLGCKGCVMNTWFNIGLICQKEEDYTRAQRLYERSLSMAKNLKDTAMMVYTLLNTSEIYQVRKDYTNAFALRQQAFVMAEAAHNDEIIAEIYGSMSELYVIKKDVKQALELARKGLELSQRTQSTIYTMNNYNRLSQALYLARDYRNAFYYQSLYNTMRDSLSHAEGGQKLMKLEAAYQLEKKQTRLTAATQQYEYQRFRRNIVVIAIVCILVIGLLLYSQRLASVSRQLEFNTQQLNLQVQNLKAKSELLEKITQDAEELKKALPLQNEAKLNEVHTILLGSIITEDHWDRFKKSFEEVYPGFFGRIRYYYPDITASELRLAAFIRLGISLQEAATVLGISVDSLKKSRYRLKKKLSIPEGVGLDEFILRLTS
jgi:tetratricopeptide (TPR) repeat protein